MRRPLLASHVVRLALTSAPRRARRWFNISFDHFGRTSTDKQTEITQDIYLEVRKNNMLLQKSEEMTFCTGCERSVHIPLALPLMRRERARERGARSADALGLLPLSPQLSRRPLCRGHLPGLRL